MATARNAMMRAAANERAVGVLKEIYGEDHYRDIVLAGAKTPKIKTFTQLAREMGRSVGRVSDIEARGFRYLRGALIMDLVVGERERDVSFDVHTTPSRIVVESTSGASSLINEFVDSRIIMAEYMRHFRGVPTAISKEALARASQGNRFLAAREKAFVQELLRQ